MNVIIICTRFSCDAPFASNCIFVHSVIQPSVWRTDRQTDSSHYAQRSTIQIQNTNTRRRQIEWKNLQRSHRLTWLNVSVIVISQSLIIVIIIIIIMLLIIIIRPIMVVNCTLTWTMPATMPSTVDSANGSNCRSLRLMKSGLRM